MLLHNMTSRGPASKSTATLKIGLFLLAAFGALATATGAWEYRRASSPFVARRAADDSRPLARVAASQPSLLAQTGQRDEAPIVTGKFRAPAPERVLEQQVPRGSQFAARTMSASFRVADQHDSTPEKVVHGIVGASASQQHQQQQQQQPRRQRPDQRTVGASFRVSDEGLNYPPSKISADIYGNMAEIVTAPPEAVDSDFLLPNSRRFSG